MLGKHAANTIASMAGSIPAYIPPLTPLINESQGINRTKVGVRPEYSAICCIDAEKYARLCNLHDILLSSEKIFEKKKYEFDCMFTCLSLDERKNWVMYSDYAGKVLNMRFEFHTDISNIENLSN